MDARLTVFEDARGFLSVAGGMLYARETVNNLILGISERLVADLDCYENPFFATVSADGDAVQLAALMTPPHNLVIAGGPQPMMGFKALVNYLHDHNIQVPGVTGPIEIADRFALLWQEKTGLQGEVWMRQRVYELRQVVMPASPPGTFRLARRAELPLIVEWLQAFEQEALGETRHLDLAAARKLVIGDSVFVWEREGEVVSMAIKTRPIAHSITVSGVYTPPGHRRRGYAGALVARLSQHLLNEGYQFVNLFTDLDNPTTNKIYQAVGFHPVCDFRMVRFTSAAH